MGGRYSPGMNLAEFVSVCLVNKTGSGGYSLASVEEDEPREYGKGGKKELSGDGQDQ
jgi:hypothetical protein